MSTDYPMSTDAMQERQLTVRRDSLLQQTSDEASLALRLIVSD